MENEGDGEERQKMKRKEDRKLNRRDDVLVQRKKKEGKFTAVVDLLSFLSRACILIFRIKNVHYCM